MFRYTLLGFVLLTLSCSAESNDNSTELSDNSLDPITMLSAPIFERVSQGYAARLGELPHQVSLQINGGHFCGGSIINQQWTLTAAHCVSRQHSRYMTVRAGIVHLYGRTGQIKRVARVVVHERYGGSWSGFANDIALLKLETPFQYNTYVRSIDLPESVWQPSGQAVASGWGLTVIRGYQQRTYQLLKTQMPIQTPQYCRRIAEGHFRTRYQPSQICAGSIHGGGHTCQGDSGGPLMQRNKRGVLIIIGLTSWGSRPCGDPTPGFYTNVAFYTDWIRNVIRNNNQWW